MNDRKTISHKKDHHDKGLEEVQHAVSHTLQARFAEAEEFSRQLIAFNYVSGHDLQEPLRKIRTFSSRLLEKESDRLSEQGKEYAKRLSRCAEKMQTIIHDLAAFARLDLNNEPMQEVCLDDLVLQVIERLIPMIREKKARITYRRLGTAWVLPSQFCDLLYHIIHNALKFSHPGRPLRLVIRSRLTRGGTKASGTDGKHRRYRHLSFEDNGIGFEQKYCEKIFDLFQRLNAREEFEGNGIGLSICKKIVLNHSGFISARSEPGHGSIFDVYLPLVEV